MKYDDASWHRDGDFPPDLPSKAASTHIALFLAWAVLYGLASEYQKTGCARDLARLKSRTVGSDDWFAAACDETFTDEDLSTKGNAFAGTYYGGPGGLSTGTGGYLDDYARCFPGLPSLYHVPVGWSSCDRIAPILSRRFRRWQLTTLLSRLLAR